jgi:thiosulfate reductase / polysulfide reductase chain A
MKAIEKRELINKDRRAWLLKLGVLSSALLAVVPALQVLKRAEAYISPASEPFSKPLARAGVNGYKGPKMIDRRAVPTSCLQCVAICGLIGYAEGQRIVKIEGNPHVPNNRGMICPKGQAGVNQVYDPDRILYPLKRVGKRGEGKWKRIEMNDALDEVAGKLKPIYNSEHPEEFMFHYGRSRIKGLVNHFCKTAFGTKTIGNHTSICEVGKWLGQELTMGKHYDINDVANSKYILVMGANVMEAHTSHSYFAQRMVEAKMAGTKIVTFDVRLSNTAAWSNEWIPVRPGTDAVILLAIAKYVMDNQYYDEEFISKWTNVTADELKQHLQPYTFEFASKESTVPVETLERIAHEFATTKPGTVITYRGFVGHYNGTYNEISAKLLDAICGNMMVKGGTLTKVSGKWAEPYAEKVAKEHKDATRKAKGLKIIDGENISLPTHHVNHRVFSMIKEGSHGRPKVYLTYVYNPVYVNGDCRENIEVLKDESLIPYFVSVDTAMSESTELADLILPDATFLERWTTEAPQSYDLTQFIQLRQPVIRPLGASMDFQDMAVQIARRIGGNMARLFPYETAEEYTREALRLTVSKAKKAGKTLHGVDKKPLNEDPWQYLLKHGVILQSLKPSYKGHQKKLSDKELANTVVDEVTGVVWNPSKAHMSAADAMEKGYTSVKNAYKGYVGQMVEGIARKGFKPDKINKSGKFELKSAFLKKAEKKLTEELTPFFAAYPYLKKHIESGLPTYIPIPEHKHKSENELIMTSFKVNVQIHSRSANCKWLTEIYHENPAWLNPKTAARFGIGNGDLIQIEQSQVNTFKAKERSIIAKAHLTQGIHPEVVAVSFHLGRWAHGRFASGKAAFPDQPTGDKIWWQKPGVTGMGPRWTDGVGVHPNWIIPNAPDPVSGQWRSNDTVVKISKAP